MKSTNEYISFFSGIFEGLGSLEFLNLAENVISHIDYFTFTPFETPISIILDKNQLQTINGSVLDLNSTKLLQIKENGWFGHQNTPIPSYTFNYSNFDTVDLTKCGLQVLPSNGIFIGACSIKTLVLRSCQIHTIKAGALRDMAQLIFLDISYNRISTILNTSFSGNLDSLRELDISYNLVQTIEPFSFINLQYLEVINMEGNKIYTLGENSLYGLRSMSSLVLKSCDVRKLNSLAFNGMSGVQTIDLRYNNIPNILENDTFFGLPNLTRLILSQSRIITINPYSFQYLSNLTNLDLHSNYLTALQPFTFFGLTSLESLQLQYNRIKTVVVNSFAGTDSLLSIDLSHNRYVKVIESYAFANCSKLLSLNLTGNRLYTLRAFSFYGLVSLTEIKLSSTYIEYIEASAFNGLTALTSLSLVWNRIKAIESHTFVGMDSVKLVDLRFNNNKHSPLKVLKPYAFANISSIVTLKLDQNKIHTITNQSLLGLQALEEIFLDSTELYVIESFGFRHLIKIKILDLSWNRLSKINSDSFNGMVLLEELTIENCPIHTIDRYAFRGIPLLSSLRLSNNGIKTVFETSFADLFAVEMIDLSKNKLDNIPVLNDSADSLLEVDLSSNRIAKLNVGDFFIFDALNILDLRENPFTSLPDHSWIDNKNNLSTMSITIPSSITLHPLFYANLTNTDYLVLSKNAKTPYLIPIISHIKTLQIADFKGQPTDLNPYGFIKFNATSAEQVTVGVETLILGPKGNLQWIPSQFLAVFTQLKYLLIENIGLVDFPDFSVVPTLQNLTIKESDFDATTMKPSKLNGMNNLISITFSDCKIENFTFSFLQNVISLKEFYFKSLPVVPDIRAYLKPPLVFDVFDVYLPEKSQCLATMCWIAELEQQGVYPMNPNSSLTKPIYDPSDMPCDESSSFHNMPWGSINGACLCLGEFTLQIKSI